VRADGSTTLRDVLPVRTNDVELFNDVREHGLILITCNRDDYLSLAAKNPILVSLSRFVAGVGKLNADTCWRCSDRCRVRIVT